MRFDNAAFRVGAAHSEVTYKVRWFALDNLKNEEHPVGEEIELKKPKLVVPKDVWGPRDDAHFRYAVAHIRTFQSDHPQWQLPVVLTIRDWGGKYDVVGLQTTPGSQIKIKTRKETPRNWESLTKSNELKRSLTR